MNKRPNESRNAKRPRPQQPAVQKPPKVAKASPQQNEGFVSDDEGMEMSKNTPPSATKNEKRSSTDSTNSYNPFEHRQVAKPNTDFGSLAHMLKTSLGSGILAMPMAFKNSGLVSGMVGTIFIGILCTHCIQMLNDAWYATVPMLIFGCFNYLLQVRSSQVLSKRLRVPFLTYSKTAEAAFKTGPEKARKMGKTAKIIITSELLLSFILGNTVYVIFIAQSILQVADFYSKPGIDVRLYILMLWIPLCIICFFKHLKSLVPFSIIANIFVVVSFAITLYYIFRDIHPPDSVYYIAPIHRWPQFLTTVIFAIEGIGTVLPIENEMRNPEHFIGGRCGIAYISMTIVVILYAIIGFFGYLEYGEDTEGSITLNLPIRDVMAQVVKILIATAIFFTYALQFYVPINIILDIIKPRVPQKHHEYYSYGVRIGLVTLTIIMSIAIPKLEPVISLVGAICFSMLGLLLPSLIDTLTRHPKYGRWKWRLVKNIIIIFISLVALGSGIYVSIMDVIQTYGLKD